MDLCVVSNAKNFVLSHLLRTSCQPRTDPLYRILGFAKVLENKKKNKNSTV